VTSVPNLPKIPATTESGDIRNWVRTKMWDQVPVRICVIDRRFRIVEANRAFREAYGEWRDRFCHQVYRGRSEPCPSCDAVKSFEDGEIRASQKEGTIFGDQQTWYLVRVVPIVRPDGSIPFLIEMSTDITETKVLEKEKLEAERLAAVGQTVAGLAHGVKNLLMGLDGGMYVARIGIERGDPDRLLEGWTILEDVVERISSFIREFLEFSKGRKPIVRLIDPNMPARKVMQLFGNTAGLAGVRLEEALQEDLAPAAMDGDGIHTCLANLVSNAIDACDTSDNPVGHVVISTFERDGNIVYEVSDNGIGMDYDVKKKVFTGFFSTKASGKGTGLGLLTTSKIVQEHGGAVSFDTNEGEGSVFRLVFPRNRLPVPSGDENGEDQPPTQGVE
jgi:signal transduction histidine kinase